MLSKPPLRVRLTAWYVFLLAIILAAFGAGVYLLMRHTLYQNLEETIENRAAALAESIRYQDVRPYLAVQPGAGIPKARPDASLEEVEHFSRVFDASGQVTSDTTAAIGSVPVNLGAVAEALTGGSGYYQLKAGPGGDSMLVRAFPIVRDGGIVGVLELGQSRDDVADTLATLLVILVVAYPITLVIASFDGVFLAARALAPVGEVTGLARRIPSENLGQRLDLSLPNDEVGQLARTFDEMIARLDEAFRRQRQFTADASHELRTPLTIIKGQIDVSLQQERDPEAYRQTLLEDNSEVDRLIRLAGSLLTLTRADAGEIPLALEGVWKGTPHPPRKFRTRRRTALTSWTLKLDPTEAEEPGQLRRSRTYSARSIKERRASQSGIASNA